jgi:hypothetical protein
MAHISYAVIALKRNEVPPVIEHLKANGMKAIADWLDARKDLLYSTQTDDWKPFSNMTVGQLLNSNEDDDYFSETRLIDELDTKLSNMRILVNSGIEIFFFDVFALFYERYKKLAGRLDLALSDTGRKCCLVMPYGLSEDSNYFFTTYSEVWVTVEEAYKQGFLHPLVLRADDLTHLKNYLLKLPRLDEKPKPGKVSAMKEIFGEEREKPRFG